VKISDYCRFAFGNSGTVFAITLLFVAGCASGASPLGSQPDARADRPITAAEATPAPNCGKYGACSVLACFGYICFAFTTEGSVQAELTSGIVNAQGVATDHHGNAYVADSGSSKVLEYGPLFNPLLKTYQDPKQVPLDLDVDATNELLAVSNKSTTNGGPGSVSVYAGGSLKPTGTLTDPAAPNAQGIGIAIDRSDNCFWSLYDPSSGLSKIDEFSGCAGSPIAIVSGKHSLAGMAFDKRNNLFYIVDVNTTHHDIFKCKGTAECRALATHFFEPVMINFDNRWGFLWVDDAGVLEGPLIESINPKNGHVISSFRAGSTTDPPFGIAHAPGPQF
jgi:hypothetical protein